MQTEKLLFFPGSTLGNLDPVQAHDLLLRLRGMPRVAGFVLGVDLVKDTGVLLRAYDDAQGVTAAFNLNLLARLNREAAANFDLAAFRHEARWNAADARIEMHLVSQSDQVVALAGRTFRFRAGESLHTENSHKFTREGLMALLQATGWMAEEYWTDPADHFAVLLLRPLLRGVSRACVTVDAARHAADVADFSGHWMRIGAAQGILKAGHGIAVIMQAGWLEIAERADAVRSILIVAICYEAARFDIRTARSDNS